MSGPRTWRGNPWAVLVTVSLGFFMTLLDLTAVNVAIPSLIHELGASLDQALWVINVYVLVLAALLITAGRLADIRGPRTVFVTGVAVFTVFSVLCALARDPGQLIAARVGQGLGAAALIPQTMTIIMGTFPAERRGAALGVWGAVAGVATVAGPTLAGLLIDSAGWRAIFLLNVPVGLIVIGAAVALIPDTKPSLRRRIDVVGVVLATTGLLCVTYALTEGQHQNWDGGIQALLGVGAVLLVVFVAQQRRAQDRQPLVPFALFADRNYAVMAFVAAAVQVGMIGLFLPVMIYLQSVLGLDALQAGLAMAPAMVVSALLSPVAGRVADGSGGRHARVVVAGGVALFGLGLAWLATMLGVSRPVAELQPALIVVGVGLGAVMGPMISLAMRDVPPPLAGAASGVLNTVRQVGTILGSAVLGALLQNRLAADARAAAQLGLSSLPAGLRDQAAAAVEHAADRGADVGAALQGSLVVPPGSTPALIGQYTRLVATIVEQAYVDAARLSLILPVSVLGLAAATCCIFRAPRKTARQSDDDFEPDPSALAVAVETNAPGTTARASE